MAEDELKHLIEAADRAISTEDFDSLMAFYADDATLVVQPGLEVSGKERIAKAFSAIASHFGHALSISQGKMKVIEAGDTALVIMETVVRFVGSEEVRRASYVFRRSDEGKWLCAIDNSYGTALLDAP